ncbi:hypothetical protein [Streptomyces sp. WMMB303]|uniref:hypothetical protein n=1 Tax=Streptomyces sp. WMMB303 TaxID=3034154 RepID=UPI0023EB1DCB|nr:hypothetical protein [Streptomyces sp. WMMB303]MDF4250809.1 hypothetical protein [Streptomyces sp. WMMB303]
MTAGQDVPLVLLGVVVEGLGQHGDGAEVAAPTVWTDAPLAERTAVLSHLAWRARGAEIRYPATHPASRLALAAEREAWAWGVARDAGVGLPPVRFGLYWLAHDPPPVQLEACVRLLAAARTGALPAAPYRCAVCPARWDLRLVIHARCTGPGLEEWRCGVCARLPVDPDAVPESVDALYRRNRHHE